MVGREGFEPSKAEPTDLQSVAFDRFAISPLCRRKLEPMEGVEPPTRGLQNPCSTTELHRHKVVPNKIQINISDSAHTVKYYKSVI